MGDRGRVSNDKDFEGEVIDVQRPVPELIVAHIRPKKGTLKVGVEYLQETDRQLRDLTARNHTATHMLQWALRKVLGNHIKQAGSLVAADLLRFDFTHFQAMTEAELVQVEDLINEKIWNAEPVSKQEMQKDEAIASGAIAFFGEKYGEKVRVVKVGSFSTELCGGTHVDDSSEINLFKIANESGIAAGVRRIIAYTSKGAFNYLRERESDLKAVRDRLKASSTDEILGKLEKLSLTEKELRRQIEQMQSQSASGEVDEILSKAESLDGVRLVMSTCNPDAQGVKRLRDLADRIKQKAPDAVVVLGMKEPDNSRASLLVSMGPQAPKTLNANELLQSITPSIEGKGGGKADLAQAGGAKSSGLPEALNQARKWVEKKIRIG